MLILRRGTPIVALTTVVMIGLAILLSNRQQALYQATTQVFVNPNNIDPSIADAQPNIDPERVLETQASEARVPRSSSQALAKFPHARTGACSCCARRSRRTRSPMS